MKEIGRPDDKKAINGPVIILKSEIEDLSEKIRERAPDGAEYYVVGESYHISFDRQLFSIQFFKDREKN